MVRVLEEIGEAMTPTEVADALGEDVNPVKVRMWRMARGGQLTQCAGFSGGASPVAGVGCRSDG